MAKEVNNSSPQTNPKAVKIISAASGSGDLISSNHFKQSYLEFGSFKRLGKLVSCVDCEMSFIEDNEEDCRRHETHCRATSELKLRSIRIGDIVEQNEASSVTITQIPFEELKKGKGRGSVLSPYWKAVKKMYEELGGCLEELERDFGTSDSSTCSALFHISRLQIVAVAIVEQVSREILWLASGSASPTSSAVPDDGNDGSCHLCLSESCPLCPSLTLGIRQMWVRSEHRGRGVVFSLLEVARKKTFPRLMVSRAHVAFSQPTSDGKRFIARYTDFAPSHWVYSSSSASGSSH